MSFDVRFIKSVTGIGHLPEPEYPEIAFAGRSNVGKSSLINRLVKRKKMVKVSSIPGKTRSINYFLVDDAFYLVDLPGYGYAKVSKKMRMEWQGLISSYLEIRETLRCVVVIIDLRHSLKEQDRDLIFWLKNRAIPCLVVYTKMDKLSRNQCLKQAERLDAGLNISAGDRVLFSAKSGAGREALLDHLAQFM